MSGEPVELTIERLGRFGDGLASWKGRIVAAPGALPGERVEASIEAETAVLERILEPSPQRVTPPCAYAKRCGGCQLQHAAPALLAAWRRDQVREALRAQGVDAEIRPTRSSPPASRRRVGFTAMRTKKGAMLGFRERRGHAVVDVDACLVARPEIVAAIPALRELTGLAAPRKRAVKLHVTWSPAGLDLAIDDAKELDLALREGSVAWAEATAAEGVPIARLSWNGELVAERAPPAQQFGAVLVVPPPGAFLQATLEGQAALIEATVGGVGDARRVVDLFAGCGAFSGPLAERADVWALDADRAAIMALDRGWRAAPGLKRLRAEARDLFRRPLLASELRDFEAVVIDPPRAGAEAQSREIAASHLPRVVSVSCNPVTFARDAAILIAAGFQLRHVTPIDQFLWSPHIELVGLFER